MSRIHIRNIYCLLTSYDEPYQRGVDVRINGNTIEKIGTDLPVEEGYDVVDGRGCVVTPGFVNTHHHFYQTLTRNVPEVQDAKLFDWLVHLYEIWKKLDGDAIYYSSLLAMAELMKTGCTLSTDHHYVYPHGISGDPMAIQFAAADRLGMRFSPSRGSMCLSKKDGGLPPDSVVQSEDEILRHSEECIRKYHDPSPLAMHRIVLAPCSPFSVTASIMRDSAELARRYSVRLHTHLCETKDEENQCLDMYGMRPLELMEKCGLIGPDVFYAHGIHFSDSELEILRETGTAISHCPSSNMRLGSGICRVREMLDLGINVSLGVDGSASNDSSDMLGEMRAALMLQRVRYGSDSLGVRDVFRMATVNGARTLGYEGFLGKIKEGYGADLAIFDVNKLPYAGAQSDPVAALLFCGTSHETKHTIVNGEFTVRNGVLLGFDEEVIRDRVNEISASMLGLSPWK